MYPIFGIILSIIFGWLVQKTGSIWSSSLAHAATNVIGGGLTIFLFGGANPLYTFYGGVLGLIRWRAQRVDRLYRTASGG